MRDLVFKNLTSGDRKRKILASTEVMDKDGIRSTIRRHFVCIVREMKNANIERPRPFVHIVKERNSKECKERFFCKIKGNLVAQAHDKVFLIVFMHSLNINLVSLTGNPVGFSE